MLVASIRGFITIVLSFAAHPKNIYAIIPPKETAPTKMFQAAICLADGLNFEITTPESNTPIALNARATVPVTKLGER